MLPCEQLSLRFFPRPTFCRFWLACTNSVAVLIVNSSLDEGLVCLSVHARAFVCGCLATYFRQLQVSRWLSPLRETPPPSRRCSRGSALRASWEFSVRLQASPASQTCSQAETCAQPVPSPEPPIKLRWSCMVISHEPCRTSCDCASIPLQPFCGPSGQGG